MTVKSEKWKAAVIAQPDRAWQSEWQRYRDQDARKRPDVEFGLTASEFRTIASGPCVYCGAQPSMPLRSGRGLFRNGLDRLDSTRGYLLGNVVAACWPCNRLKRDLSREAFLELVRRVARWQGWL